MSLCHGTLASLVPSIMERGLEPRGKRLSHDAYMQSPSMPHQAPAPPML
jgi:RNA:NAD 2'-phosphotransferase (TPT1/KptA family)